MTRSITVPSHEHRTFDIKPLGECRACDNFHERMGLTVEKIESALESVLTDPTTKSFAGLRLLRMMRDIDPDKHAQYVEWIGLGMELADAVDEAMGEWPAAR